MRLSGQYLEIVHFEEASRNFIYLFNKRQPTLVPVQKVPVRY
jgi:hypothetical protein